MLGQGKISKQDTIIMKKKIDQLDHIKIVMFSEDSV